MVNVTIFGGHGKVALLTAPLLSTQGHTVQSVFRNPEHTEAVSQTGATPIVGDIEHLSTEKLAEILQGQDVVVFSAGAGGGNPDRTYAVDRDAAIRVMDAAEQASVKRFIMVSYSRSGRDHEVPEDHSFFPYATAKAAADTYLRETDLDWTILGPGRLTLEDATGKIEVFEDIPTGETLTSRANVAEVIVECISNPKTIKQTINFMDGSSDISEILSTN